MILPADWTPIPAGLRLYENSTFARIRVLRRNIGFPEATESHKTTDCNGLYGRQISSRAPDMKIEHVAINVEQPVLMGRWYVEHLGLTVKRRTIDAPHAHFLADDSGTVMMEIYGNRDAPLPDYHAMNPAELHVAFVSADVAADARRLADAGATIVADVHQLNEDTFAMLRDPWGLPIQLVKRKAPMI